MRFKDQYVNPINKSHILCEFRNQWVCSTCFRSTVSLQRQAVQCTGDKIQGKGRLGKDMPGLGPRFYVNVTTTRSA